jgi:hypothetical protein
MWGFFMKKMSLFSILILISFTLTSCLGNPESNRDQVELPSEGEPITTPPPELDENPPPPSGADSPYPLSDNIFFVGHSLVSPTLPAFMNSILQSVGGSGQADYQVINGSPLVWNWKQLSHCPRFRWPGCITQRQLRCSCFNGSHSVDRAHHLE